MENELNKLTLSGGQENILRRIHFHIASSYSEDACTAPHCLPHQKFAMNVHEKVHKGSTEIIYQLFISGKIIY